MAQIIDIVRIGSGALRLYARVPRGGWFNQQLGRTSIKTYLRLHDRWYDSDGWRIQSGDVLDQLEDWRMRWNEGKNPVILWDEV